MNQINQIEVLKTKRENWSLLKMEAPERAEYLRTKLVADLIKLLIMNNDPLRIKCLDEIEGDIKAAITAPITRDVLELVPQIGQQLADVDDEEAARLVESISIPYENYIKEIEIQAETLPNMVMPNPEMVEMLGPDQLFIRVTTARDLENQEIQAWLQGSGLGNFLSTTNVRFTEDHVKTVYFMLAGLAAMNSQRQQPTIQSATANLIKPH